MSKDESDFLLSMYQEHTTQGRHHETQRNTTSTILVAIAGGVVGFIANKSVEVSTLPLAAFLVILGSFGALFSAKQTERARFHIKIAGKYRKALEKLINVNLDNRSLRKTVEDEQRESFPVLNRLRLFWFWIGLYMLIAGLGMVLIVMILAGK